MMTVRTGGASVGFARRHLLRGGSGGEVADSGAKMRITKKGTKVAIFPG
jgi:hypothetical protein